MSLRTITRNTNTVRRAINKKPITTYLAATFATSARKMSDTTISDAIKKDHREIESYAKTIMESNDHDTQTRFQNQFTWELARHSIAEELVVYPAMEKYMGEAGKAKAEKDRAEHRTVKEQLKKFQNLKASSPEFLPTLQALMADLGEHIAEEERDDLPALEQALASNATAKDTTDLAKSFGRTKMFVPSRSHPSAPDKPPFETAMGLLAAPLDHIADMFRKFPNETVSPNPSTK